MDVSIIVATHGRLALLEQLLKSLEISRKKFNGMSEVLLIDDSDEAMKGKITELAEKFDATVLKGCASVSRKRNMGAQNASGKILLFLDSDCIATEDLIEQHYGCYKSENVGAAAGPLEFVGEENHFWKAVERTPYTLCFKMPYWGKTVPWGTSANLSVRKSVFEEIQGFDKEFPNRPGGEDVDLGIRIVKRGYIIVSVPKGLVYHDKRTWSVRGQMYSRVWFYGGADYYLIEKHWEYTVGAMPRRSLITGLIACVSIIQAICINPTYLLGLLLWILLDMTTMAILMTRFGYQKSSFVQQLEVQIMLWINEVGFIKNCLRHGKPKLMFRQMIYFDNQLKGIAYNGNILIWNIMCNLSVMLIFYTVIKYMI